MKRKLTKKNIPSNIAHPYKKGESKKKGRNRMKKGNVYFNKARKCWFICWWNELEGKNVSIYGFKDGRKFESKDEAVDFLAGMRSALKAGTFNIDNYIRNGKSDVIPLMQEWLKNDCGELAPATIKDYRNSIVNHLEPWFKENPYKLRDLKHDILCRLMNSIKREGKGKRNTMGCLHSFMAYICDSGTEEKPAAIDTMPRFPKKYKYKIIKKPIRSVTEERQRKIISAIPEEHQPIFWWLTLHVRRPSEAMALHKVDYREKDDYFYINRAFSNKKLVQHTKTGYIHETPVHDEFKPIMEKMDFNNDSPFFFINPTGRLEGQHYQHDFLVDLWNKAAKDCGEDLPLYCGTKHTRCMILLNEKGYSKADLKVITDHRSMASLDHYCEETLETKRKFFK